MQVAVVTGRIAVWPDVPCNVSWIATDGLPAYRALPNTMRKEWLFYGRTKHSLHCTWLQLLREPCLFKGRGMLALEFEHLKQMHALQVAWHPTRSNTLFAPSGKARTSMCGIAPHRMCLAWLAGPPAERVRHARVAHPSIHAQPLASLRTELRP